jgi:WXG100 family type VII secretion target
MAGDFRVDTSAMQSTAQGASNIADNMITQARTLGAGIEFVRERWRGQAGDAFRAASENQKAVLDQLIQRLQTVSETIKRGGQGFDGHDSEAHAKVVAQGQQFLNGSLNHS